jgi:hypothetical protein
MHFGGARKKEAEKRGIAVAPCMPVSLFTARNFLLAERSRKPGFGGKHGGERELTKVLDAWWKSQYI